ncbi:MAG: two-component sensor histidine kinase [Desulfobacteraceae bacterium 4572_123]|nr:MAG: two-component sensor histidine kinase [Desulfobacteraceae bacterium 4572_123]
MKNQTNKEKVKPFRLVKYFSYSSLIVMFLGTIALSVLNTHWARTMQRQKSEDYAILLVENLNHQVFLQFIIPVALKFGKIQLRKPEQFTRMDKIVRSTMHSFNVETVNIFDMDNVISYSFDQTLIGKRDLGGTGYMNALTGVSSSKVVQNGNFWEILLGIPKNIKILTFAPLRAEKPLSHISGPVLGVVEIVQDISKEYKTIFRFQIFVVLTITSVMGILFTVLLFVVKKGNAINLRRTQERILLEEALNRARHMSTLGEMTAGISHEIRNPLGIISSSAELLKKKMAMFDPANTIPDIIIEESNRLNNIITDFLNFAKPIKPDLKICRVEKIIDKNMAALAQQIQDKKYDIEVKYDDLIPEIMADFNMLYQAFLNILINAMQAMPEGGKIRIEIKADNNTVTIFFKDEGPGISEEILEKIWNPFFTTKSQGTGLGLGIVKNIIESHRGKINARNRSSIGAQIIIELPISIIPDPDKQQD